MLILVAGCGQVLVMLEQFQRHCFRKPSGLKTLETILFFKTNTLIITQLLVQTQINIYILT